MKIRPVKVTLLCTKRRTDVQAWRSWWSLFATTVWRSLKMKLFWKRGTRNFALRRKVTSSSTVRSLYAWSSTMRPSNTCSFIVSQTLREDALKRCVNFHSRAKACMKLHSHEGIREVSVWDKRVGLRANPENKDMCEILLPDQRMREIALRDQGMREVERISEVSLWDQGTFEVSLSDEAAVKFDSEIPKDVNRKKRKETLIKWCGQQCLKIGLHSLVCSRNLVFTQRDTVFQLVLTTHA
jgi:hypothetical protein